MVLALLIELGCNVDLCKDNGRSPCFIAAQNGFTDVRARTPIECLNVLVLRCEDAYALPA